MVHQQNRTLTVVRVGWCWTGCGPGTHQDGVGFVPEVPEDPEPHGPADDLRLQLLVLGQLGVLAVLGLDVGPASGPGTTQASPDEHLDGSELTWRRKRRNTWVSREGGVSLATVSSGQRGSVLTF